MTTPTPPFMTPAEKFVQPVEGYGFNTGARVFVAAMVIGLLLAGAKVAFSKQMSGSVNMSAIWQVGLLAALVVASGWQIVFGKTRIDQTGLRRASFWKPHLKWQDVNKVAVKGIFFAPRLSVSSPTGPVRFNAGTPELLAAFKQIDAYYNRGIDL
jgi:hypothetical protein